MAKKTHDPTYDVKGPNIQPPPEAYDVKGPYIEPPPEAYDVKSPDLPVPPGVDPKTGEMTGGTTTAPASGSQENPGPLDSLGPRPEYVSKYGAQLDAMWDDIINRKFSYDADADALYKSYRDRYMQQGKLAMQNTMGQAAGLTGGYGNTYAQGVGQQAYDQYLTALADKGLDLRNQAFSEYQAEGNELRQNYGLLSDREDQEYNRYLDSVDAWESDRAYLTDQSRYLDSQKESALEMLRLYGIEPPASLGLTEEEMAPYRKAYQESVDKEKNEEIKKEIVRLQQEALATGIMPSPEKLAELGVDESVFQPYIDRYQEGVDEQKGKETKAELERLEQQVLTTGIMPSPEKLKELGVDESYFQPFLDKYREGIDTATAEKDEKKREAAEQKVVSYMQMGVVPTDDELAYIGRDRAWAKTILKYYGFNADGTPVEQPTTGGGRYVGGNDDDDPPPQTPPQTPPEDPITGRTSQQQADLDGLYELLSPVNGSRVGSGGWSLNPEIKTRNEAMNIIREAVRRGIFGDNPEDNKDYQALVKIAQRYPIGSTSKPGD